MEAALMWGFWYLVLYLTIGRATSISIGPLRINYDGERGNQYGDGSGISSESLPRGRARFRQLNNPEDKSPRRKHQ